MVGLAVMAGCSSSPSSTANVNAPMMLPVDKTTVVGKLAWLNKPDGEAIIELNSTPLKPNTVLAGLNQDHQISAVLVATSYSKDNFQGFKVLSGQPGENDDIVEPGMEYAMAVQSEVNGYLTRLAAAAANPETMVGTTSPNANSSSQSSATAVPNT